MIFLLRELLYLELPSNPPPTATIITPPNDNLPDSNSFNSKHSNNNISNNCNNNGADSGSGFGGSSISKSTHRHLVELYPLFCECITSSEKDLKDLLKEIFYLVGKEFLAIKRL